jgi:predicted MFS family arabinose efflux permease
VYRALVHLGSLRDRNFRLFWLAETISNAGNPFTELALPLTALILLQASPFQVGLLRGVQYLPFVLFGLVAGVVVDRSRPAPLLIGSDLGRLGILLSVPIVYFIGHLTMVQVYLVAFAAGILTLLQGVAQQAATRSLVERDQLIDANAKIGMSEEAAGVVGPGLAGLLIGATSAPVAIVVDAASFGVSAALISRIWWRSASSTLTRAREPVLRQIREGLAFILHQPVLRALAISISLLRFFMSMFVAVEVVYYVRVLHLSPTAIGLVFAAMGLGGVGGAAAAGWLNRRFGVGRTITVGFAPLGWLLIPLAPASAPIPWLVVGGILGAFSLVASNVSQLGLRQSMTPRRLQGRMTASMRFVIMAPAPLGALLGGTLGTLTSLRATLWLAALGAILTVVPLILAGLPGVRSIAPSAIDEDDPAAITNP